MGLPPLAGFWSKDEILVGTGGWGLFGGTGGNGTYVFALVMGIIGAALTLRLHDTSNLPNILRRISVATLMGMEIHTNQESASQFPLMILAVMATGAGFLNFPVGFLTGSKAGWQERFGHYVEPVATYFPPIAHGTQAGPLLSSPQLLRSLVLVLPVTISL